MREGNRANRIPMPFKRLQARAPAATHRGPYSDAFWLVVLEQSSDRALSWAEQQCGKVYLERVAFDWPFVVHDKPASVLKKLSQPAPIFYLLAVLALILSTTDRRSVYATHTWTSNHSFVIEVTPFAMLLHRLSASSQYRYFFSTNSRTTARTCASAVLLAPDCDLESHKWSIQ